jgi:hypothetical protein
MHFQTHPDQQGYEVWFTTKSIRRWNFGGIANEVPPKEETKGLLPLRPQKAPQKRQVRVMLLIDGKH